MEIRPVKDTDDRTQISRIYEESWRFAYKDIIPQSYLDSIPSGKWAAGLDSPGRRSLLMTDGGRFIGTSSFCGSRFPEFKGFGEIISIYLLPEYMGLGYGKLLMDAVISELSAEGFRDIFLWVLEDNRRARRFYEKYGFVSGEIYLDDNIGGKALREIWYRFAVK